MDHYYDKWTPKKFEPYKVDPYHYQPVIPPQVPYGPIVPQITPDEIEEFRKLLDRARKHDKDNHQEDCELEEKRKKIKDLAKDLGVDIDFV